MGDFFRSTKFKILLTILIILFVIMFLSAYLGGRASPISQVLGVITAPLQRLSSTISGAATDFFERYLEADQIYEENLNLKDEIRALREQMADYEQIKRDNEHFRDMLDLKESNPEFEFQPAEVIGRDDNNRFYGFTINQGSLNGISVHDPVITSDGLVGWISEVGLSYAKVITILDVSIDVGAVDTRTRDSGVITGDIELAAQGMCKLGFMTRESMAAPGDIIKTSGLSSVFGMVFPKGLMVGTVREVRPDPGGIVLYAVVEPSADVIGTKDVFVLTYFPGQASETPNPAGKLPDETPDVSSSGSSSIPQSSEGEPDDQ